MLYIYLLTAFYYGTSTHKSHLAVSCELCWVGGMALGGGGGRPKGAWGGGGGGGEALEGLPVTEAFLGCQILRHAVQTVLYPRRGISPPSPKPAVKQITTVRNNSCLEPKAPSSDETLAEMQP